MMLRHPGECFAERLGEGCSSTAFGQICLARVAVWSNPTNRGSATLAKQIWPAAP
jgi:hypothetical protein